MTINGEIMRTTNKKFLVHQGTKQVLFAVMMVCFLQVVLYALPSTAYIELSPREMWYGETNQVIDYKLTNGDTRQIKSLKILVPSGFTYVSSQMGAVSSNKYWEITGFSANEIGLVALGEGNYLVTNEYLTLKITVNAQNDSLPPTEFGCMVVYNDNNTGSAVEKEYGSSKITPSGCSLL